MGKKEGRGDFKILSLILDILELHMKSKKKINLVGGGNILFKAIERGVSHVFYKLVVEFLLSFKLLFKVLKSSNYFLKYDWSKSGSITGSLWEGKIKTAKKDYFI